METAALKTLLQQAFPEALTLDVTGDGHHFVAIIVAHAFVGLNKVKQQQLVYEALREQIATGELHAISLKTYAPEEWQKLQEKQRG